MAKEKSPTIEVEGITHERIPIRTHVITETDDIVDVAERYAREHIREGDILFVSEKVVAVTQGRALRESEMRIGLTARILWRFVHDSPYGVGLRRPSSMQCAVSECGVLRIWCATFAGALGKLIGKRGWFYRVAGMQAAAIDAAGTSPLQPDRVIMGPKDPDGVSNRLRDALGIEACVVDVNDLGSNVLGATEGLDRDRVAAILRDNPLGQKSEQTPLGLIRVAV
jgi:F420-0:Gamma-glutamyl ligase